MRIRRSRLTADFVQLPNGTVRDERLSYMARGILAELLSRPDGWETTADDLWRRAAQARPENKGEGRRAFRAAFAELKDRGYLTSATESLPGGRHGTVLTVHDLPQNGDVCAGGTDVPHAGTSEGGSDSTDVPHAGTSERAGETGPAAGRADVPPAGTSVRPAERGVSAGRSDVPHAGTSLRRQKKKTEKKKTESGDGRQATTGSGVRGEGGFAAPDKPTPTSTTKTNPTAEQAAAIGAIIGLLPPALRDRLPARVPAALVDAIREELERGLNAAQLVERTDARWNAWGLALDADTDGGGRGLHSPVGAAIRLFHPGYCPDPRCIDGVLPDTGASCRTCEERAADRAADRAAERAAAKTPASPPRTPLRAVPAPTGHTTRTTSPRAPHGPVQLPLVAAVHPDPTEHPETTEAPAPGPPPRRPADEQTALPCPGTRPDGRPCEGYIVPRTGRPTPELCGACRTEHRRHA
ncbi:hypothetical protein GCM10027160_24070 [Streptomyces calidiresistens]